MRHGDARRKPWVGALLLALLGLPAAHGWAATYTYSGNHYALVETGQYFAHTDKVTGWFSVLDALPADLVSTDIRGFAGFSFSFSARTPDPGYAYTADQFLISTDPAGAIIAWHIELDYVASGVGYATHATIALDGAAGDEATDHYGADPLSCGTILCSGFTLDDRATAPSLIPKGTTGSEVAALNIWVQTSPGADCVDGGCPPVVPEPGTILLLGTGLAGLARLSRRKRE